MRGAVHALCTRAANHRFQIQTTHKQISTFPHRYVSPDILAMPPPAGLLAALAPAPSKKRKSICELHAGQ